MPDLPICFVCFDTHVPGWGDIGTTVMQRLRQQGPHDAAATEDGGLLLDGPGGPVAIMPVEGPCLAEPSDDLSQQAIWPNLGSARPMWRSHVIVAPFSGSDTYEARRENIAAVVRAAAAYASLDNAAAVCWSGNGLFIPPATFCARAEVDALHPEITVRSRWWRKAGIGVGAHTTGLASFGLPELSHPPTGEHAGAIHDRLLSLARFLIEHGSTAGLDDVAASHLGTQVWVEETRTEDGRPSLVVHRSEVQAFT